MQPVLIDSNFFAFAQSLSGLIQGADIDRKGFFRVPGNLREVREISVYLDNNLFPNFSRLSQDVKTTDSVVSFFKTFLKKEGRLSKNWSPHILKEKLLLSAFLKYQKTDKAEEKEKIIDEMIAASYQSPSADNIIFYTLLSYLFFISQREHVNKMSACNLSSSLNFFELVEGAESENILEQTQIWIDFFRRCIERVEGHLEAIYGIESISFEQFQEKSRKDLNCAIAMKRKTTVPEHIEWWWRSSFEYARISFPSNVEKTEEEMWDRLRRSTEMLKENHEREGINISWIQTLILMLNNQKFSEQKKEKFTAFKGLLLHKLCSDNEKKQFGKFLNDFFKSKNKKNDVYNIGKKYFSPLIDAENLEKSFHDAKSGYKIRWERIPNKSYLSAKEKIAVFKAITHLDLKNPFKEPSKLYDDWKKVKEKRIRAALDGDVVFDAHLKVAELRILKAIETLMSTLISPEAYGNLLPEYHCAIAKHTSDALQTLISDRMPISEVYRRLSNYNEVLSKVNAIAAPLSSAAAEQETPVDIEKIHQECLGKKVNLEKCLHYSEWYKAIETERKRDKSKKAVTQQFKEQQAALGKSSSGLFHRFHRKRDRKAIKALYEAGYQTVEEPAAFSIMTKDAYLKKVSFRKEADSIDFFKNSPPAEVGKRKKARS